MPWYIDIILGIALILFIMNVNPPEAVKKVFKKD